MTMADTGNKPLLAEKVHDQDLASDSEGSATDDNDFEPRTDDRRILDETEQHESLLAKPSRLDGVRKALGKNRGVQRGKKLKEQAEGSGSAELMYEMESGYKDTSSRSSSESIDVKRERWQAEPTQTSIPRLILIGLGVSILFGILLFGSYKASHKRTIASILSNGTHTFGPTTILISLDGFRADFLQRGLTPAMNAFVSSGVSPKYMLPSFPSLTFPNHFTLVTGLYPESHGIVSNQFWDPSMQEEFYYTNVSNSMQPKWWNAEPVWVTAEKQGLKTAIHMWPGSEAHIMGTDPTYLDKFNGTEALDVKVNRILEWLDMPQEQRPQFIGAYVPNVDADGHLYGPNSTEIRATIIEVDQMLTSLIEGLFHRNLTEVVNLVIVSDHGMATTSNDRLIQLDNLIDLSLVDHIDGWPLRGLRLKNPDQDVPILYKQLLDASKDGKFDVYTLETMPERYHFRKNDRIAPLWVIPRPGWAIVEKVDFDVLQAQTTGQQYHPIGLHGYDHEHPLMRAIFVARGPAFPHLPNSRLAPFQNTEVYNIVCDSLGIDPHPNNGTLRLPLKTQGLHSDFEEEKVPDDPTPSNIEADPTLSSSGPSSTDAAVPAPTDVDQIDDKSKSNWWDFVHNQIEKAKDWAKQMLDSIKHNLPNNEDVPTK